VQSGETGGAAVAKDSLSVIFVDSSISDTCGASIVKEWTGPQPCESGPLAVAGQKSDSAVVARLELRFPGSFVAAETGISLANRLKNQPFRSINKKHA